VPSLIDDLVDSNPANVVETNRNKSKNVAYIWDAFHRYKVRLGQNRWALYNAFTDWSTHSGAYTKASNRNIASVRANRQEIVRKAFARVA
jgi:hypothetical protein